MVLIQYLIRFTLIIPKYGKENVLSEFYFALLLFCILLIVAAGYTINDYFDITKIDDYPTLIVKVKNPHTITKLYKNHTLAIF